MSGITHLYEIYNKKGKDFVDSLLNSYVTVNEKIDGSAFVFERNQKTGEFDFYKRDLRNPITMVDRTLMKYYEKPISYIESLPKDVIETIPYGWKFGLEYMSSNSPVEIVYDRVPKNNLILSYIHKKYEGRPKETVQNKEELDEWADLLGVERPPIIFQGKLSDDQKARILEFLRTPFDELVNEYKTRSFVAFIIGILNPELKNSALNLDLSKPIEGIVFRFGEEGSEEEPILSKMVDPVFTEIAKEKAKNRQGAKPSDFLGITILDVMNFILQSGVESFDVEGRTEDERYVSFISDVFAKFLEENYEYYKNIDFQEPQYLKRDEFRLNKKMIKDKRVLEYVEQSESLESLYKLILNSFRKIKKRPGGVITQEVINQFNSILKDIEKKVQPKKEKINESGLISFLDFKKMEGKKIDYLTTESEDSDSNDDDLFYSYNEFISALEKIDTAKKSTIKESEADKPEDKELEKVNLIVGRFQPFHNGHLKMIKELNKKNGLPCLVCVVNTGRETETSPFNEDLVNKYMESLVKENHSIIRGYFLNKRGLLGVIYGAAKSHGYLVKTIGAGADRIDDYRKQENYLKKNGPDFPSDIELIETPRSISATEVRETLKNEDFTKFKKMVPSAVSSLYPQLVSAIKGTDVK